MKPLVIYNQSFLKKMSNFPEHFPGDTFTHDKIWRTSGIFSLAFLSMAIQVYNRKCTQARQRTLFITFFHVCDVSQIWKTATDLKVMLFMLHYKQWMASPTHEFEQALGDGERQGSLACCSAWGHRVLDMTEWPNSNMLLILYHTFQKSCW